jgi:hypothetical protein
MKSKKSKQEFFEECPLVEKLNTKQKGLFRINGMCFVLEHFPELKVNCPTCGYYKEIPPKSYSCKRFYCTSTQN